MSVMDFSTGSSEVEASTLKSPKSTRDLVLAGGIWFRVVSSSSRTDVGEEA